MTADELVNHIAEKLNLSAPDAKSRILSELNVRYRQVTSSIGLITTRRVTVSQAVTQDSDTVTFTGIEKLDAVFYKISTGATTRNRMLDLITDDEMLHVHRTTSKPTKYSVFSVAPSSVTINMNCVPSAVFTLYAHGLVDASSISGSVSPAIPASFHDILIHGVEAEEYKRKTQLQLAADSENKFENRLSDLRMFIAKSAYQDMHRGKHTKSEDWWDYNRNN